MENIEKFKNPTAEARDISPISKDELVYVENVKENSVEIIRYIGTEQYEELIIPQKIDGKVVTKIGKEAFVGNKAKRLVIQEGLKYIDWYAFKDCSNLTEIHLPRTLEYIGLKSFEGCRIEKLEVPQGVKRIEERAFYSCPITWVIFKCENATIGKESFKNCQQLQTIDFLGTIKEIGGGAFWGCDVRCIQLPTGLVKVEEDAFYSCKMLESVYIPKTVKFIEAQAFSSVGTGITFYCEARIKPLFWNSNWTSLPDHARWGQRI